MRQAVVIALGLSVSGAVLPALASYGSLPPFFAESWAIVDAAPLLRVVPSQGKQARLPIRTPKPADAAKVPWPAALAPPSSPPPQPSLRQSSFGEKPEIRPTLVAYASLGPTPPAALSVPNVLADIPLPIERPDDIPLLRPKAEKAPEPETKVAMLGTPLSGITIGNLVKMAAMNPVGSGACHVDQPFSVLAAGASQMDFSPAATLNGNMAKQVGLWARQVELAAQAHLGQKIETIMVAGSYDCRTMNHIRRARLSEHSHANALDVAGFRLANGQTVTVAHDWYGKDAKAKFLQAVHAETCGLFQVVLGPGSDGYHENHLHMDLGHWKACR